MADQNKVDQDPEYIPGGGAGFGMEALKGAVEKNVASPEAQAAEVLEPTSAEKMGNPKAYSVSAGTAKESDEDLIARLSSGQVDLNSGGEVQPGSNVPAQVPSNNSQSQYSPEAQAAIDRLTSQNEKLAGDAALGAFVKSDERIMSIVGNTMQGNEQRVSPDRPVQPQQTIEAQLGLPPTFVPISEDFNNPGTDSYRWFRATLTNSYQEDMHREMDDREQKAELTNAANQARANFLASGRTEADLEDVLKWGNNFENFDLMKLWKYMHLEDNVAVAANARLPRAQNDRKQYVGSIASKSGGGIHEGEVPEGVKLQSDLLGLAKKNENPLI